MDVASTIYGKVATYTLSSFTGVSTGDFTLTLGGFTHHLTGINLTAAGSLSVVAADVQAAIRAYSAGGAAWTSATVVYNSTRKSFDLESGLTGDDVIAVTAGVVTDIASLLGWLTGAILSDGQDAQTITEVLTQSDDVSSNFGSFAFLPSLTLDEVTEAATWNNTLNIKYIYSVPVSAGNASSWSAALADIGGVTLTLSITNDEYPEQVPMMQEGATNYNAVNGVSNYMFQQFNLTPSVTTNANADIYDALRINYYGQTQSAGQFIAFYQRGIMLGLPVDPADQNIYANEIWLKDALTAQLMTLLLALPQLAANSAGRSQVLGILQGVINLALINGVISVGKTLSDIQKADITFLTNDPNAWQQVFSLGYVVDVDIVLYVESSVSKYKVVYTLIYSKDDVIRKITGTNVLI